MRTSTRERTTISTQKRWSAATQIAYHQLVRGDPRELAGLLTFGTETSAFSIRKRINGLLVNDVSKTTDYSGEDRSGLGRYDLVDMTGTGFPVTRLIQDAIRQAPTLCCTAGHYSRAETIVNRPTSLFTSLHVRASAARRAGA